MNDLPDAQLIQTATACVVDRPGFSRQCLHTRIVKKGGLYVFCNFLEDETAYSFYDFEGRRFFQTHADYSIFSRGVDTSKIWGRINGSIILEHTKNNYATKSLEYIALMGEKERWKIYCCNQPE